MTFRRFATVALCTLGVAACLPPATRSQECIICQQGTTAGVPQGLGGFPASQYGSYGGAPAGTIALPQGYGGSCSGGSAGFYGGQSIAAPTVSEDSSIAIGYPSLPPGFGAAPQTQDVQVQYGGGYFRPRVTPRSGAFLGYAQFGDPFASQLPIGWEVIRRPRLVVYYYRGY